MSSYINLGLRLATAQDQPAVDGLLARSYPQLLAPFYAPDLLQAALPIITRARTELLTSGSYWLVLSGARVVGAGGWTQGDPSGALQEANTGHVRHVATDPDYLRLGIGRALMGAVMDNARAAGMIRLSCLSTLAATPFYQAMGFAVQSSEAVMLSGSVTFPSVRMLCDL